MTRKCGRETLEVQAQPKEAAKREKARAKRKLEFFRIKEREINILVFLQIK